MKPLQRGKYQTHVTIMQALYFFQYASTHESFMKSNK